MWPGQPSSNCSNQTKIHSPTHRGSVEDDRKMTILARGTPEHAAATSGRFSENFAFGGYALCVVGGVGSCSYVCRYNVKTTTRSTNFVPLRSTCTK